MKTNFYSAYTALFAIVITDFTTSRRPQCSLSTNLL